MNETDETPPASSSDLVPSLPQPSIRIPSPRHTLPLPPVFSSSSSTDPLTNPNNYSEISSNQRYIRSSELISQDGNIKYSFKAFDTQNGTEIVWQKVILSSLSEEEQRKITESANYLRAVRDQHILVYLDIWLTEHEPKTLNLITSYLDTLKQFVGKIGSLRWRIIKKWCKQILQALAYLHNSTPQIIHRNLTWRNIFVNPGVGDLYVGGMWLAAIIVDDPEVPISVSDAISTRYVGSPPYRAPEMTESPQLTTKMDIYSFGICVLAMVIGAEPYSECNGDVEQIAHLAARGVAPLGLKRIQNAQCVDFIECCLRLNPEERLSAEQLSLHPFLQPSEDSDDKVVSLAPASTQSYGAHEGLQTNGHGSAQILSPEPVAPPRHPTPVLPLDDAHLQSAPATEPPVPPLVADSSGNGELLPGSKTVKEGAKPPPLSAPLFLSQSPHGSPNSSSVQVRVSSVPKGGVVTVELRLGEGETANGVIQDVEFLFNIEHDNYEVVAAEMKQELNLTIPTDQLAVLIQHQVDAVLSTNGLPLSPAPTPAEAPPETETPKPSASPTDREPMAPWPSAGDPSRPDEAPPTEDVADVPSPALPPPPATPLEAALDLQSPRQDLSSKSDDLNPTAAPASASASHLDEATCDDPKPEDHSFIPKPGSDASPEELADFTELLRELDKIDKDCRAARRVFEQRIQKHKIIQDSCEEDLLKIESDRQAQGQLSEKSEIKAQQKKEEALALAKNEFETKIQRARDSHTHRHEHRAPATSHPPDSTSPDASPLSGIFYYSSGPGGGGGSGPDRTSTPSVGTSGLSSIVKAKS